MLTGQFSLEMHYPPTATRPYPLTATVRSSVMSPVYPQLRFVVKGSKGSFVKYGMDAQLPDLARLARGDEVPHYGEEGPEGWGELTEAVGAGGEAGSGDSAAGGQGEVVHGEEGVRFVKTK